MIFLAFKIDNKSHDFLLLQMKGGCERLLYSQHKCALIYVYVYLVFVGNKFYILK